jgi:hypothetical protein
MSDSFSLTQYTRKLQAAGEPAGFWVLSANGQLFCWDSTALQLYVASVPV